MDGRTFVAIDNKGRVIRWRADALTQPISAARLPPAFATSIASFAVSPRCDKALISVFSGQVVLVDLRSGGCRVVYIHRSVMPAQVAWGPGEHPIWSAGDMGHRKLYVADPSFSHTPRSCSLSCSGGLFVSPDGSRLLATCVTDDPDPDPSLIDLRTFRSRRLVGHATACESADFSPDGTRIVTAGVDNTVRLWDTVEGANLQTWRFGFTPGAIFGPDGDQIVVLHRKHLQILRAATPDEVSRWTQAWSQAP